MKNFNVTYKRPQIDLDDAAQLASFESLYQQHEAISASQNNTGQVVKYILLVLAVLGLTAYLVIRDSFHVEYPEMNDRSDMELITPQEDKKAPEGMDEFDTDSSNSSPEFQKQMEPEPLAADIDLNEKQEQVYSSKSENIATGYAEAAPVSGFPALYQYFEDNLIYPPEMVQEAVEGNVIVKFVIDTTGTPGTIIVEKSLHEKLDIAAISLIENMPSWFPARLNGKAIPSTHRIPLYFQIEQSREQP